MEDAGARLRSIVREEIEATLSDMERRGIEEGHASAPRLVRRWLGWGIEMAGALLLGVLCGILSQAAVVLLVRTLR